MGNLLIPYRGVIEIFGGIDTGKTLASLQTVFPYDKTTLIDSDVKGSATIKQMLDSGIEFGKYIDLSKRQSELGNTQTPDQLLKEIVYPVIDEVASGEKQDVIIFDNWRIIYQAARMYVDKNQHEFKDVVTFRGSSQIIQGLVSRVARQIELKQINMLRAKCDLLIITTHLKSNYVNNVVVGEIPESSKNFDEICSLRIWLKKSIHSKVPTILFLKRPNMPVVKDGKLKFVNVVPMKITPNSKDESIWDAISRYEKNPIESRQPTESETPTETEFAMLSGTLTSDQKSYVLEVLKHQKEEAEEITEVMNSVIPDPIAEDVSKTVDEKFQANVPKTGSQFLTMAMSNFGMNVEAIREKIDVGLDKIMKADEKELGEMWQKLK